MEIDAGLVLLFVSTNKKQLSSLCSLPTTNSIYIPNQVTYNKYVEDIKNLKQRLAITEITLIFKAVAWYWLLTGLCSPFVLYS